jgi:ribonuclease HI
VGKKKQYYVVVRGHKPGIYEEWFGENGAAAQIEGFRGALHKGFHRREDAVAWLKDLKEAEPALELAPGLSDFLGLPEPRQGEQTLQDVVGSGKVLIYTDGGAIGNPGPGGYGAVLRHDDHRRELSGGYRLTTNNRMELMACIKALEALRFARSVVLFSDSRYVVDGITEGWAERWRANEWQRNGGEKAENVDLWARLLDLCDRYEVEFRWVEGHAGNPDNERCDQLAKEAARQANLPPDSAYEADQTQTP